MEYKEEDYLNLAGIQHFTFCRRQWALIHIEQQWDENLLTVQGELMHVNAHNTEFTEKRGELLISRGMDIHSSRLGVSGKCDIVEFRKSKDGVSIFGQEGLYSVYPVEYKHGSPKTGDEDVLQLTAQAICLEEMLCCKIEKAFLYYGEIKRRKEIVITEELRKEVETVFHEMHQMYQRRYTPNVKRTKKCNACSLKEVCLPVLSKTMRVNEYLDKALGEGE